MKEELKKSLRTYGALLLLGVTGVPLGAAVGLIEALFCRLLLKVTAIRVAHLFWCLPFLAMAGLVIVAVNQKFGGRGKGGMSLIFDVAYEEETELPLRTIPLAMLSTALTHLFGGSAGREGDVYKRQEHTPAGKYFAVLNVDFEPEPRQNGGGTIGIDVGIKTFYSDSNGNTVSNPRYLERSMRKLIREQRRLSRKRKDSHNREKQRIKVAGVHEKVTNQRNDFLQKQSTMLVRESQTICIEDLNVKGMIRNHKLAKSIASVSWAKFFEMLEYKAIWYGNEIRRVPTMYPSSQTCSFCGCRNPLVKNLCIRIWECPKCHTVHDRDTNASINILKKGLQMQSA